MEKPEELKAISIEVVASAMEEAMRHKDVPLIGSETKDGLFLASITVTATETPGLWNVFCEYKTTPKENQSIQPAQSDAAK